VDEVERTKNRTKSKVRARVEHSICIIKRVFDFAKVRYRGLKKNTHRLLVTCALANPVRGAPSSAALRQGVDYPQCVSTHINNRTRPRQRAVTHPIARRRIFYVHSSCADPCSDVP
jgi:hypothetical protein